MYLDLEDYRPDTPHLSSAIHGAGERADVAPGPRDPGDRVARDAGSAGRLAGGRSFRRPQQESVKFVHMVPAVERPAPPKPNVDMSDLDRRATAPERAAKPTNPQPFSVGNTPEKTIVTRDEQSRRPRDAARQRRLRPLAPPMRRRSPRPRPRRRRRRRSPRSPRRAWASPCATSPATSRIRTSTTSRAARATSDLTSSSIRRAWSSGRGCGGSSRRSSATGTCRRTRC